MTAPAPRRRSTAAAAAARATALTPPDQGSLDQGMIDLPVTPDTAAAHADAAAAETAQAEAAAYLADIEAAGKVLVAVLAGAPPEDADDLRRIVAILRSVYRRQRSRLGSVL